MPVAPTYDESQAVYHGKSLESNYSSGTDGDRWISGTHHAHRTIAVVYNPNPTGAVNQLDERVSSFAPGVGVYEWRMVADEVGHGLRTGPEPNSKTLAANLQCSGTLQLGLCSDSSSPIQLPT